MSSEIAPQGADAEVINLHPAVPEPAQAVPAVPAEPEHRVVTGTVIPAAEPGTRRPVIPQQWQRANIAGTLKHKRGLLWHESRYYGLRLPKYLVLYLWHAVKGAGILTGRLMAWWQATGLRQLESAAVAAGRPGHADAMRAHERGLKTRAQRTRIVLGFALPALLAGLALARWAPWQAWALLAVTAVLVLSRHGRRPGERVVQPAVVPAALEPITLDVVVRALGSLGLAGNNQVLREGREIAFIPPGAHRDGPGWRVDMDLPYGVTAGEVIERRDKFASGLRRPIGCVWPEPDAEQHEGRLVLFVGDEPLSRARQPAWPLAQGGKVSLFRPVPFGTDQRGKPITVLLMFANLLIGSIPRMGKALALDTPVPTPGGWTTMGELRDGDPVFGADGQPCKVLKAWPVRYDRPCYEVHFSDGSVIVADAEHLWQVSTRSGRVNKHPEKLLTTARMIPRVRVEADGRANYAVRVAEPLACPEAELPVPPYTLGAWLGNGSRRTGIITEPDPEVIAEVEAEGETCSLVASSVAEGKCPEYRIADLTARLRQIGVLNGKHIPVEYLRASEPQRRALLAGLLDTDGYCATWGLVQFAVTCERLARDAHHLVATLGYKPTLTSKPARYYGKDCGTAWIVTFTPADKVFRLPRKAARQVTTVKASAARRFITEIRPIPSVPVRCITVDSPDALYLVGQTCIPTHNTVAMRVVMLAAALDVLAELHIWELKGTGDLEPLARVAHAYGSGADDETIKAALGDLRKLYRELERRAKVIRELPTAECPERKVTPELAGKRGLRLHPVVFAIDECQEAFSHPDHGAEFDRLATGVIKRGPALGIMLVLATQRPDAKSLPTGISANVAMRFCLRVMDQVANDMVLGTSAYKRGINSTLLALSDKGVGWAVGFADASMIVKTYGIDGPAAERVTAAARTLREAAGTLSGFALGQEDGEVAPRSFAADVLAVFGGDARLRCSTIARRLAERIPNVYADTTAAAVSSQLRQLGVTVKNVREPGEQPAPGAQREAIEEACDAP